MRKLQNWRCLCLQSPRNLGSAGRTTLLTGNCARAAVVWDAKYRWSSAEEHAGCPSDGSLIDRLIFQRWRWCSFGAILQISACSCLPLETLLSCRILLSSFTSVLYCYPAQKIRLHFFSSFISVHWRTISMPSFVLAFIIFEEKQIFAVVCPLTRPYIFCLPGSQRSDAA